MGKKKSVVLMTLLTIVIVVLSALTAFPAFSFPGDSVKQWNPAIMQYDLGMDLGGGYYAYYYPEGVKTETEIENDCADLSEEEKKDYMESYYNPAGSSLYFDTDDRKNIVTGDAESGYQISDDFTVAFDAAAKEISARFAARGYSDYTVSIVDGYAIKVTLPASDVYAAQTLASFMLTDEMTIAKGDAIVDELKGKEAKITDLVKGFSVVDLNGAAYLKINFTKAGKKMVAAMKNSLTESTAATGNDDVTMNIKIGDETIVTIYKDFINNSNAAMYPMAEIDEKAYVKMVSILMNSVLKEGDFEISFNSLANTDIRKFDPVYGKNTMLMVFIAAGIAMLGLSVFAVLKMGRFGGVSVYNIFSYLIVVGLCFAFISKGIFEITLGSVLIFLAILVVMSVLHVHIYNAVKAEFNLGKTVESSVKAGFNKTIWTVVDVYAVLLLGSLALLIGGAGMTTFALQAIICIVTGAFCNLLWGRFINYTFLSASKNKYKYFRFVREDDDDE